MVAEWVAAMSDLRFIAAKCAGLADGAFEVVRDFKDKRLFAPPEDSDSEGDEGERKAEAEADGGPGAGPEQQPSSELHAREDERGEREPVMN